MHPVDWLIFSIPDNSVDDITENWKWWENQNEKLQNYAKIPGTLITWRIYS